MEKVTVFRARCNGCGLNVSLVTKLETVFKEGENLGVSCKAVRRLKGCKEDLVFFRYQGTRPRKGDDKLLENYLKK
jgi:hypothetical protein|tara:strand:- start:9456 stop:9683 length:228 start_codon:yes stop_codon:yes gene_type:complete